MLRLMLSQATLSIRPARKTLAQGSNALDLGIGIARAAATAN